MRYLVKICLILSVFKDKETIHIVTKSKDIEVTNLKDLIDDIKERAIYLKKGYCPKKGKISFYYSYKRIK